MIFWGAGEKRGLAKEGREYFGVKAALQISFHRIQKKGIVPEKWPSTRTSKRRW